MDYSGSHSLVSLTSTTWISLYITLGLNMDAPFLGYLAAQEAFYAKSNHKKDETVSFLNLTTKLPVVLAPVPAPKFGSAGTALNPGEKCKHGKECGSGACVPEYPENMPTYVCGSGFYMKGYPRGCKPTWRLICCQAIHVVKDERSMGNWGAGFRGDIPWNSNSVQVANSHPQKK